MLVAAARGTYVTMRRFERIAISNDGKYMMRFTILPDARKLWIYRGAVIIVLAAGFVALQFPTSVPAAAAESTSSSPTKPTVPGGPTPIPDGDEQAQLLKPIVVPATIQAFFVTDLYAKNAGYVSQINNDIGDHVKKGQVL